MDVRCLGCFYFTIHENYEYNMRHALLLNMMITWWSVYTNLTKFSDDKKKKVAGKVDRKYVHAFYSAR